MRKNSTFTVVLTLLAFNLTAFNSGGLTGTGVPDSSINEFVKITSEEKSLFGKITATDDTYTVEQGESVVLKPLTDGADDSEADGNALSVYALNGTPLTKGIKQVIQHKNGSIEISASGIFTYTPKTSFTGTAKFKYIVVNGLGDNATAKQIITVTPVDGFGDPIIAIDDLYTMDQGETIALFPLTHGDNDSDPMGFELKINKIAGVKIKSKLPQTIEIKDNGKLQGTVLFKSEKKITYTAITGNNVKFSYEIRNTEGDGATANQIIKVTATGPILAFDDNYSMEQGETIQIRPLSEGDDDTDPKGLVLRIVEIAGVTINSKLPQTINIKDNKGKLQGTVLFTSKKNITFTTNGKKDVTFNYVIKNTNDDSATAKQIIKVKAVDGFTTDPTATDDTYTMDQGETIALFPLTHGDNDSDPMGLKLKINKIAGVKIKGKLPQTIKIKDKGKLQGTVLFTSEKKITYTAITGDNVTFSYEIKNTNKGIATANQIIEVTATGPIQAFDDNYSMEQGETIQIRPLSRGDADTDPQGLVLRIVEIAGVKIKSKLPQTINIEDNKGKLQGTVLFTSKENITFTTNGKKNVKFTYVIKNTNDVSATAKQIIKVTPVDGFTTDPTATDDTYTMDQGESIKINPLTKGDNDSDPMGSDLSIYSIAGVTIKNNLPQTIKIKGKNGKLEGNVLFTSKKNITYTPLPTFFGTSKFLYKIENSNGASATAKQIIIVTAVEGYTGGITATDDTYSVDQGDSVRLRPLKKGENDSDILNRKLILIGLNNEPLTGSAQTISHITGKIDIDKKGKIFYSPNDDFFGTATFQYTVSNGSGGDTATANQIIIVDLVDGFTGSITATDDSYQMFQGSSIELRPLTRNVADSDYNGNEIFIKSINGEEVISGKKLTIDLGKKGVIKIDKSGTIIYTPKGNFIGTAKFPYVISNKDGDEDSAKQIIVVLATPSSFKSARAVNDLYETPQDMPLDIDPLTKGVNDSDIAGDALFITYLNSEDALINTVIPVPNGNLYIDSEKLITFTPNKGYNGVVLFSYEISNVKGNKDVGTVTIKVGKTNDVVLDVNDIENNIFSVYPNPSKGNVNVSIKSNVTTDARVILSDLTGRVIYDAPMKLGEGRNDLDFNVQVNPGVMFLRVVSAKANYGVTKILFK